MADIVTVKELAVDDLVCVVGSDSGPVFRVASVQNGYVRCRLWCSHNPGWDLTVIPLPPDYKVNRLTKDEAEAHKSHVGFIGDEEKYETV